MTTLARFWQYWSAASESLCISSSRRSYEEQDNNFKTKPREQSNILGESIEDTWCVCAGARNAHAMEADQDCIIHTTHTYVEHRMTNTLSSTVGGAAGGATGGGGAGAAADDFGGKKQSSDNPLGL